METQKRAGSPVAMYVAPAAQINGGEKPCNDDKGKREIHVA